MPKLIWAIPILLCFCGCVSLYKFSPELQSKWQGHDISEMNARLGTGEIATKDNGERYYYWRRVMHHQTNGMTKMGSCELRVFVDNHDRILRLDNYTQGMNCIFYTGLLK
ncbi:hypothetical protein [Bartonella choladocola]|uniref:Uncharacterized protein n=1 Tax=Bartonella choladocola TaxID=2750995 RepID=A0A1U9MJR3_9HYPH|nr:hypothetical protein [Bartonella choladocola]AQT47959.1 hypothetical protein BBC0122_018640 [Bartonella choladocola]